MGVALHSSPVDDGLFAENNRDDNLTEYQNLVSIQANK